MDVLGHRLGAETRSKQARRLCTNLVTASQCHPVCSQVGILAIPLPCLRPFYQLHPPPAADLRHRYNIHFSSVNLAGLR